MGRKEDDKRYYEKNKEKIKEYFRHYYLNNNEKIKRNAREYYANNRDKIKLKKHLRYLKNKREVLAKNKEWLNKNKKKFAQYQKDYQVKKRKEDLDFRIRHKLRTRLNVVMNRYGKGKKFKASTYGINYKKIIEYLRPFPKEIDKYHVDHVKPLCSFDLTDPKQVNEAFAPENHQWLLAKENLKKGGMI